MDVALKHTAPIDVEEASKILTKYIADIIENSLNNVKENGGLQSQVTLINKIVSTVLNETDENAFDSMSIDDRAEQLLAFFDRKKRFP